MVGIINHNSRITRITAVSPKARLRIASEGYRFRLNEDEITDEAVIEILLEDLVSDLYTVGVELHCSLHDLLDTYIHLDYLVAIAHYYLPETLGQMLKTQIRLRRALETIMDDDLESSVSMGGVYLQHLGLNDDCHDPALEPACLWLQDKLITTAEFPAYVTNLLCLSRAIAHINTTDDDRIVEYVRYTENLGQRLNACLSDVSAHASFIKQTTIESVRRRLEIYQRTITRPDVADMLSQVIFPMDDVTVRNQISVAQAYREFCLGEPLYIERHLSQSAQLTPVDLIGIAVRVTCESSTKQDATESLRKLSEDLDQTRYNSNTQSRLAILTPILLDTIPA